MHSVGEGFRSDYGKRSGGRWSSWQDDISLISLALVKCTTGLLDSVTALLSCIVKYV